jgi:hypothetical protein
MTISGKVFHIVNRAIIAANTAKPNFRDSAGRIPAPIAVSYCETCKVVELMLRVLFI